MGHGYHVIDADGHVFETFELWQRLREDYMPTAEGEAFGAVLKRAQDGWKGGPDVPTPFIWEVEGNTPMLNRSRPLGPDSDVAHLTYAGEGRKPGTEAARDIFDGHGRLRDMDREGIDVMVIYPSTIASFCALESRAVEASIYHAYNRWISDHCQADPARLKYVGVVSLTDIEAGVAELRRAAQDPLMVGMYCQTHMGETQLDHPRFHPLWDAAQELNLPAVIHHASAALPPYGLGMFEMNDCWFLQHASSNPFEQMRAIATMIGGGVFERFPKLQVAFLEAGCGWLPYWLDRLNEHHELMSYAVPQMTRSASEVFASGRCYISFEPEERMLPSVLKHVGDDKVVYASDYPHFDCDFPDSVRKVVERSDIGGESKRKILSENAKRLYPRLA